MKPCLRCYGWGIATGVALWWIAALLWEECLRPEPTDQEDEPDDSWPARPDCFRELPDHVSSRS